MTNDHGAAALAVADTWQPAAQALPQRTPHTAASATGARELHCGAAGCGRSTGRWWRRTARPIFEGAWACSRACLDDMASAAVHRAWERGATHATHAHRVPLGLLMLSQGWITHPQLRHALTQQRAAGTGRIGDWLTRECGVSGEQISLALSLQWNRPLFSARGMQPARAALAAPRAVCDSVDMLPLRVTTGDRLMLGFTERCDEAAALALEHMLGAPVDTGLLSTLEAATVRDELRRAVPVPCLALKAGNTAQAAACVARALRELQPVASRLVRAGDLLWLRCWLEPHALSSQLPMRSEDIADRVIHMETYAAAA